MRPKHATLQAIYGGTFDPIHYGHLNVAEALAEHLRLTQIVLMPNNVPPHRPQPQASSAQRKSMIALAIANNPLFRLDCRELRRATPSWTVETLEEIRAEIGMTQPLGFIIGQDSLHSISHWHQWEKLLSLCHLLVCRRPGYPLEMATPMLQKWLNDHQTQRVDSLHSCPAGYIYLAPTPLYDISATEVRRRLTQGLSCQDQLPPAVWQYIQRHHLYR